MTVPRRAMTNPFVATNRPSETRSMPLPPTQPRSPRFTALRVFATASFAGLMLTALAACDGPRVADAYHPVLTDPARRHPITMLAEIATLDLGLRETSPGTDARAFVETTRFLRAYRHEGRGPITIAVPRGGGGSAAQRVRQVRLAAHRAGIPAHLLRVVHAGGAHAVRLSYDRIAAVGPTCGLWQADVTRNPQNLPYENWGCASQRNLATMAANPLDLAVPALETPRSSEQRAQEVKNYNAQLGKGLPSPKSSP